LIDSLYEESGDIQWRGREEIMQTEDGADVLSLNETTTVPYGSFTTCLKTKDYTALEPGVVENKYFAPGVGNIQTVMVEGGSEHSELVKITTE
jgi:hypothetical protein